MKNMIKLLFVCVLSSTMAFFAINCDEDDSDPSGTDLDSDMDADSDTDTDADSDTDADADGGTGDADTDTDSDADGGTGDTDADTQISDFGDPCTGEDDDSCDAVCVYFSKLDWVCTLECEDASTCPIGSQDQKCNKEGYCRP